MNAANIFLLIGNTANIVMGMALMQLSPLRNNPLYRAFSAAMLMALSFAIYYYAWQIAKNIVIFDFGEILLTLAVFFKMTAGVLAYRTRCFRCGPYGCMPPTI